MRRLYVNVSSRLILGADVFSHNHSARLCLSRRPCHAITFVSVSVSVIVSFTLFCVYVIPLMERRIAADIIVNNKTLHKKVKNIKTKSMWNQIYPNLNCVQEDIAIVLTQNFIRVERFVFQFNLLFFVCVFGNISKRVLFTTVFFFKFDVFDVDVSKIASIRQRCHKLNEIIKKQLTTPTLLSVVSEFRWNHFLLWNNFVCAANWIGLERRRRQRPQHIFQSQFRI